MAQKSWDENSQFQGFATSDILENSVSPKKGPSVREK